LILVSDTERKNRIANVLTRKGEGAKNLPLVERVLSDPQVGWMWVVPRVWLGSQWTEAAQHKIVDPQWMRTGEAFRCTQQF